jgi:hypothetical protein
MDASMPRVLLAARPVARELFRTALSGHADLIETTTLQESLLYLKNEPPPALVCCTVLFDESRMFDLLRWVKVELPGVAFICARALARDLTKFTIEAVEIASRSLGATAFIDVPALTSKYGDAEARERLRLTVLSACGAQKP